ncbi:TPA: hypothetical protein ACKJ2P_000414, partial [Neisseria gonorrhoeae]
MLYNNADKKRLVQTAGSRDGLKAVKFRSRKASDSTGSITPPPGHQKWTQKKSSATRQARSAA